jgi:hypothetical protein
MDGPSPLTQGMAAIILPPNESDSLAAGIVAAEEPKLESKPSPKSPTPMPSPMPRLELLELFEAAWAVVLAVEVAI